jgi:hypothetical protein
MTDVTLGVRRQALGGSSLSGDGWVRAERPCGGE